jgi:molecular chaperone DnaJ
VPEQDYYALLGVSRTANEAEIKRAYLQQARELHPDTNPDPTAEERFKAVNQAYETLRDPERRRQYDMFGAGGPARAGGDPFAGAQGFGDLFDVFFGGGSSPFGGAPRGGGPNAARRGDDAKITMQLEFSEAVFGVEHELTVRLPVTCSTCEGRGAQPGTLVVACPTCKGTGEVRRVRQSVFGQMVTASPCQRCGGSGTEIPSPCPDCRGEGRRREERSFIVEVPAGVDSGSTLRLTGRGAAGVNGGPAGDLYVALEVLPHPTLVRDGSHLRAELHVAMTQAALGAVLAFETLEGPEDLTVAAGTQTGREIRLRGKGVPHLQGRGRGDLLVTVVVDTPTELTKAQEEQLRALAADRGEAVAPHESGLVSKLRGAFK